MMPSELKIDDKLNLDIISKGGPDKTHVYVNGDPLNNVIGVTFTMNGYDDNISFVVLRVLRPSLEVRGEFDVADITLVSSALNNRKKNV